MVLIPYIKWHLRWGLGLNPTLKIKCTLTFRYSYIINSFTSIYLDQILLPNEFDETIQFQSLLDFGIGNKGL